MARTRLVSPSTGRTNGAYASIPNGFDVGKSLIGPGANARFTTASRVPATSTTATGRHRGDGSWPSGNRRINTGPPRTNASTPVIRLDQAANAPAGRDPGETTSATPAYPLEKMLSATHNPTAVRSQLTRLYGR